jgi:RhoGEF, Guanine nucleotide exchange factor for Rho/Rac/Cdc42-like GTPases
MFMTTNENINNDMLNNENTDDTTLEAATSENVEESTEDMTSDIEAKENEDGGNLPQNPEPAKNKKKAWIILATLVGIAVIILTLTSILSKDKEPKEEPIDYMQYVQGVKDLELETSKDKYDYLSGITFDKEHIKEITVDDSQVDLTKVGEYQLTYLIDVKDEKAEDLKQAVTVKVISAEKQDDKKKEEAKSDDKKEDKTQISSTSTPSSQNSSSNAQSKPSNTNSNNSNSSTSKPSSNSSSSSGNSTSSKPSNSGSSNNSSSSKPTSPTHAHSWEPITKEVYHEEKGHWTEPEYKTYEVAVGNQSGLVINGDPNEYLLDNNNGDTGWHSETRQEVIKDAEYVIDKAGWTETVTTGYHCSCGATK